MLFVIEGGRRNRQSLTDQVVTHDDDRQACRTDVFLRPGVDQSVSGDIDRPGQYMGRHVCHQRDVAGLRNPVILHAADGFVGTDVDIARILAQPPGIPRRDIGEIAILAGRCDVHIAVLLRFLDRFLRPFAGIDVVGDAAAAQQIHWHDCVLPNRPALQEQHLVIWRNGEQFAKAGFGMRMDRDELLAAMAHFHDRHARTMPVQHLVARFFQNLLRQDRGPCAEIEYSPHFYCSAFFM